MRSASTPASPLAPGRSRASVRFESPLSGIHRTWTLRKNTMPVGPQVLERVREHVRVHERAPRLPRAELAQLAVRVAQPERRLARVDARAEQLELELRLQLAHGGGRAGLHPEARLAHAGKRAAVLAELVLVGRQLRHAHGVEPVGVDLRGVLADVQHREAVDRHRRLRFRSRGLRRVLRPGARRRSPAAPAPSPAAGAAAAAASLVTHMHDSLFVVCLSLLAVASRVPSPGSRVTSRAPSPTPAP